MRTAMEIEKKFTIKYLPTQYDTYPFKEIVQGYLCENPVIRIRKSNDTYILTYKSKIGLEQKKENAARINHEVEVPLTKQGYEHLKEKIDGNLIEKTRYLIPLQDKKMAELDVFHGKLEGLIFVEVEFDSEEEAEAFIPPEWFGDDVTLDKRYVNKNLIYIEDLSQF